VKLATFNVNSIRKRLPIVLDWLKTHQPDALCMQETKVSNVDFPVAPFEQAGYHVAYLGSKGYAGVATATRVKPDDVVYGLDKGPDEEDARVIRTVVDGLPIVNTYVPQGTEVGSERYAFKLEWFRRMRAYFDKHFSPSDPVVWVGDMNVAPEPIDVYHPEKRLTDPCFHPDARKAYKETLSWGFVDVFRQKFPDRVQYTYWDYWRGMVERNFGWRLDHILVTKPLVKAFKTIDVDMAPRKLKDPSDHTVVWAELVWKAEATPKLKRKGKPGVR
jgi:exodeoxyribonuclease III